MSKTVVKNMKSVQVNNSDSGKKLMTSVKVFKPKPISQEELIKIILSLENKSSPGYNDAPLPVIRYPLPELIEPLLH